MDFFFLFSIGSRATCDSAQDSGLDRELGHRHLRRCLGMFAIAVPVVGNRFGYPGTFIDFHTRVPFFPFILQHFSLSPSSSGSRLIPPTSPATTNPRSAGSEITGLCTRETRSATCLLPRLDLFSKSSTQSSDRPPNHTTLFLTFLKYGGWIITRKIHWGWLDVGLGARARGRRGE